jgi:hypothetical protein
LGAICLLPLTTAEQSPRNSSAKLERMTIFDNEHE